MTPPMLPYGRQWIDDEDIAQVTAILQSDWITSGKTIDAFEEALAEYCGAKYAVAVSSGTAALHLAYQAAGIQTGHEVVTSPITFVATSNAALYCGAQPAFVDIDPQTCNISPKALSHYVSQNKSVRAVAPVHFAGYPCDMEQIYQIARANNLTVIEDACHALGARWQDSQNEWHRVGSCSHSDMAIFSFHPVKHITTGEGGAILTNDANRYQRLKMLRSHGVTKASENLIHNDGPWYYEMHELGYNYRITDFQCALGINQLAKLDGWLSRRREIASKYHDLLSSQDEVILPFRTTKADSAYHLFPIQLRDASKRKTVFETMQSEGIGVQVHYIPVHLQPYYQKQFGYQKGDFSHAENYYSRCFSLPIFPQMTDNDILRVVETLTYSLSSSAVTLP